MFLSAHSHNDGGHVWSRVENGQSGSSHIPTVITTAHITVSLSLYSAVIPLYLLFFYFTFIVLSSKATKPFLLLHVSVNWFDTVENKIRNCLSSLEHDFWRLRTLIGIVCWLLVKTQFALFKYEECPMVVEDLDRRTGSCSYPSIHFLDSLCETYRSSDRMRGRFHTGLTSRQTTI